MSEEMTPRQRFFKEKNMTKEEFEVGLKENCDNRFTRALKGKGALNMRRYTPGTAEYWRTAPKNDVGTSEVPGFRTLPEGVAGAIEKLRR